MVQPISLGEKSCEIKDGGQEMAAMMLMLINFNNAYRIYAMKAPEISPAVAMHALHTPVNFFCRTNPCMECNC